jgi:hypothetical protein
MGLQIGVKAIKVANIAADGGLGTQFAPLSRTRKGTLTFNPTKATKEKILVEEQKAPIANVTTTEATLSMSWTLTDWDVNTAQNLWGGAVVNGQWQEPDVLPVVERSLRIEPEQGKPFIYPRVELSGDIAYDNTGRMFQIEVTAEKLQPEKEGQSAFLWGDTTEA